jgi:hypothetical protein
MLVFVVVALFSTCVIYGLMPPAFTPIAQGVFLLVAFLILLNLCFGRIPLFPYDRILSAHSPDGLVWYKDPGVRIDVGGGHSSCQVYFPHVIAVEGGWRMYYRAGGYGSIIASAFSCDGMVWKEERGERIGLLSGRGLLRLDSPTIVAGPDGSVAMYFAGHDGRRWRLFTSSSRDGLNWQGVQLCLEQSSDPSCGNLKDPCLVDMLPQRRLYCVESGDGGSYIATATEVPDGGFGPLLRCKGYECDGFYPRNPSVVALQDGQQRMYFSEYPHGTVIGSRVVSAISLDGVNWQRETGVRISPGGEWDRHGSFCPHVIAAEGGGWCMYYGGYWGRHLLERHTLFVHAKKR